MPRKSLNKEMIVNEAISLIEETGYGQFSMRELAARLDVKASSLYNHVEGLDEINAAIGLKAIKRLNAALTTAVKGKESDKAFISAAQAYRKFAQEHPELYETIIEIPMSSKSMTIKECPYSLQALANVIIKYHISNEDAVIFFRSFWGAMRGFIDLELSGFLRDKSVGIDVSYEKMLEAYIKVLHLLEHGSDQERS